MSQPVFSLKKGLSRSLGGKVHGLSRLIEIGFSVPPGFIIRDAKNTKYLEYIDEYYTELSSSEVAVRSSAQGEDGFELSFAGQYETILNVANKTELLRAIDLCVASLKDSRAEAYRQENSETITDTAMNVLVQHMVKPRVSGVVFSADPSSGRRDLLIIDVVAGLGESLVSGRETPDHYALNSNGLIVRKDLVGDTPLLDDHEIKNLGEQARAAAEFEGHPLDLEWAIDETNKLYWLQARPITTLPADLNEFDTILPHGDDLLTTSNISEMMPGAVCPLTISFTGGGIDYGLQAMQVSVGVRDRIDASWQITASAYGHLFLNLTGNLAISAGVFGSSADQAAQTLCGRKVPELMDLPSKPWWIKLKNTFKLIRFCIRAPHVVKQFEKELSRFSINQENNAVEMLAEIRSKSWFFNHCMAVHIQSSALSGFLCAVTENLVSSKRNDSTIEEQAKVARLLSGANGVESAVMLEQLDMLIDHISKCPDVKQGFQLASPDAAILWLREFKIISEKFEEFLDEHGHRGLRELCMRDQSWREDLTPLTRSMQAAVNSRFSIIKPSIEQQKVDTAQLSRALRWIIPKAHSAIRRRELTKSYLVEVAYRFKIGFRRLGALMHHEGLIPDSDLVNFFSVSELPDFISTPSTELIDHAMARRRALDYQQRLEFPDVSVGRPEPIFEDITSELVDGELKGRPASCGVTQGLVRVAHNLDEAAFLKPNEILITPITDIGWTPYFSLISALVTDLGSSVSHGAVIAREYGLPCVVNTRCATRVFSTGDKVQVNGDKGTIRLVS